MPRRNGGPRLRWSKKRNCWYIYWTELGRSKERSTGTTDRDEAEIIYAEFLRERQRGSGPRDPGQILITDILTDYVAERGPKVKAAERLSYAIIPLVDYWQGKCLTAITRQTCENYNDWRERSAGTVRRELTTLRAAINHAFKENRVTRPVPVILPERPPAKDRWLTKGEAERLLTAAGSLPKAGYYLKLFIMIALHTGQRKEAVLSLRWPQVDLNAETINWNPPGRTQTKKRRPVARIPPQLLPTLKRARQFGDDLGYVVHVDGRRVKDIKKSFAKACEIAELKDVSPHTLRHTRATWGMQAGAKIWELSGFLGMTPETLEKVYGHHHPDFQRSAAENY